MKQIFLSIATLCTLCAMAQQPKEITTKVSEVVVFTEGAQITRKKKIDLPKGITELKFRDLSPFINPESIQIKATSGVTIMSVSHQINYFDKLKSPPELEVINKKIESLENQIQTEKTHLSIVKENIDLLQKNKDLSGKNAPISAANLQQVADLYNQRMTDLKFKENKHGDKLADLTKELRSLENQKQTIAGKIVTEMGEVLVKVNTKEARSVPFELSYVVNNASWTPSYDLRANDISKPISLIYKANVKQDTKENWENVKLTLSSSDPYIPTDAPELRTYFLGYNTRPPVYDKRIREVSGAIQGIVVDKEGQPILGAYVVVKGTHIGVATDFDGKFLLSTKNIENNSLLEFSFLGMKSQTVAPKPVMTIVLEEDDIQLEEVVVTSRSRARSKSVAKSKKEEVVEKQEYIAVETKDNSTNVRFEIKEPYSIPSNNQVLAVDMQELSLPTDFQYHIAAKVEPAAFLLGYVTDWEKYNLLEGEASVFFEETYIGKTTLSPSQASDTLKISFGQDKKIVVNREKVKDFTSKKFMGGKKEVTKVWKTTIRNTKSQPVKMVIFDQVPVSTLKEIEVNIGTISGGKLDKETGKIQWETTLQPAQKQEIDVEYIIKYPKEKRLIIE